MPAVQAILKDVPADSLRTILRAFQVQELLASVTFSSGNIVQGAITNGSITDGSGSGPNYKRMLTICPTIALFCQDDISKSDTLIAKCDAIADMMVLEKARNPKNYFGTPDDQQMFEAFGEYFGPIHIGTGEKSSGDRVTDLELIRWRTTLLGADGMVEKENTKRLLAAEKTAARLARSNVLHRVPTTATASVPTDAAAPVDGAAPTDAAASGSIHPLTAAKARQGKTCSNFINCPERSHYNAATCKTLWTKCAKDCSRCGPGKGGSMHVCAHPLCKAALAAHML